MIKSKNSIKTKTKGYFDLTVLNKEGLRVEEKCVDSTDNAITFGGAFRTFCIIDPFGDRIVKVGQGTTPITRSSGNLSNPLAPETPRKEFVRSGSNETDNLDGTATLTLSANYVFTLGAIVGTISEVGIYEPSPLRFVGGQLIQDEFGDPTTVTLLSDEQLIVTYTIELTYPNDVTTIGTGTITTPSEGTVGYTMYAQPYFYEYSPIGDSNEDTRYVNDTFFDEVQFFSGSGNPLNANTDTGSGWSISHDGSGTVTYNSGLCSFTPASFNSTDIKGFSIFGINGTQTEGVPNFTTGLLPSNSGSAMPIAVIFDTAISKSGTESLSFELEFTITV